MVASAAASLASTYVWGRLADRSSRRVLMIAATLATLANATAAFVALAMPDLLRQVSLLPALLFVLMIAHQGVRLGRFVHIVDMADRDNRATYTALSNSTVGVILLAGGIFGVIAQWLGIGAVLAIFTVMAAATYTSTDSATVTYKTRDYRMQIAVSGSGARYVDGDLEWWTKGSGTRSDGTLLRHRADGTSGEIIERCTEF